ncbi:MAG: PTS transporter subunit EIIB, partial [Romboutsia sp.]
MDFKKIAKEILINVGTEQNIQSATHCYTRLRFLII